MFIKIQYILASYMHELQEEPIRKYLLKIEQ